MKADIDAALGEVHILVNCAGGDIGASGGKPVPNNALDIAFEDIKVLTDNNLIGTMLVCQAFVPPMVAARRRARSSTSPRRRRTWAARRRWSTPRSRRRWSTTPAASPRS